jgi:folylpolyglutamate synthase/dihydropteroate synthase
MNEKRTVNILVNNDDIVFAVTLRDIAKEKAKFIKNEMELLDHNNEPKKLSDVKEDYNNYFTQIEISWEAYKAFKNDNSDLFYELTGYYFG